MRIAICDNENDFLAFAKKQIEIICKRNRIPVYVECFLTAATLINDFAKNEFDFDLVLLDIDMPNINGKQCAKILRNYNKHFKLIFVTSYQEEVYTSFDYNISGFIPKSMLNERMGIEIQRIYKQIQEEKKLWMPFKINLDNGLSSTIKIPVSDIIYFESVNRKIYLHTLKNTYSLNYSGFEKLKAYMMKYNFIEIHRLCIVNVSCIFIVSNFELELDNHEKLPISRRNYKKVVENFTKYLKQDLMQC
ncbi:MAG: response regulator transcription factor [Ruminococcus sp.]|nr:response regulator transcription factor [Ruminococcus sp.]